jgi:GAF domain-containing protein
MAIEIRSHEALFESVTRISGLLLSQEKLDAILELVVSLTSRTLPSATGVSVTLVREGEFTTATYSNEITKRVDEWQYAMGEGPCLSAATDGQVYLSHDISSDARWPDFGQMATKEGITSVLAVPFVPMGQPIGTLNIYASERFSFDEDHVDIAKLFAEQAAIVIANSVAYSDAILTNGQLQDALESREVIGQATGVLMERERVSADRAFEILSDVSMRTNRKVREVAADVVSSVTA